MIDANQQDFDTRRSCLKLQGTIAHEPKSKISPNGKLVVEVVVLHMSGKKRVYLDFVCLTDKISEYILEHFHKGDFIDIKAATPTSYQKKGAKGLTDQWIKWVIWDIEEKEEIVERRRIPMDGERDPDEPYY